MEDEYLSGSDFELEYSDDDSLPELDVALENQYYTAKSLKKVSLLKALDVFQKVLDQQVTKGIWGFRSLKQMTKICFRLGKYKEMLKKYEELLTYTQFAVSKSHTEKSINNILELTSRARNNELSKSIYDITLTSLQSNENHRLWFRTNIKLGQVYLENHELSKLSTLTKTLKQQLGMQKKLEESYVDTYWLEIYALEIQMYLELKNYEEAKTLYKLCLNNKTTLAHPLLISVIKESGGKIYLKEEKYEKAYTDFFEAFLNFDEACSLRKYTCLKYILFTNMLMKSEIDPFHSPEIKPHKNCSELKTMIDLIAAYQANDLKQFEFVVQTNKDSFMEDEFMADHIVILLKTIRIASLKSIIKPYRRIKISHMSDELGIGEDKIEELLISCILDGVIHGRIDQVNNCLVMSSGTVEATVYDALHLWASKINDFICSKPV